MSKNYSWDKYVANTEKIPNKDKPESYSDSKDEISCDSLADEIQEILANISPDQAGHVWHVVGVFVYQQIGGSKSLAISRPLSAIQWAQAQQV